MSAEAMVFGGSSTLPTSTILISVVPHEAVPEVSKGKIHIAQNKHVPIEWFVTTASHFPVSHLIEPFF